MEEECGRLTVKDGVGYAVEYSLSSRWHDDDFEALYWLLLSGKCKFASSCRAVIIIMRGTVVMF